MGVEGIGARVARKEDKRFLTGKGRYTDDMVVPGMKYAYFVRSPYAHARIAGIDASAAKAMPGVIDVLDGKQLLADGIGNLICGWMIHSKDGSPMKMGGWRPLAHETVRYVGDAIAIVVADIWQWTPLMFLILLAGLAGVPEDQLKAATLLGASWPQRFRTIILPKMKTIIIIALAIRVIENFKIFDTLYIMTGGGPGVATETISVYIYKVTQNDLIWGYVAAIALVILIVLSIGVNFAINKMNAAREGGRK